MYIIFHPVLGYFRGAFRRKWTEYREEARTVTESRANALIERYAGAEKIEV